MGQPIESPAGSGNYQYTKLIDDERAVLHPAPARNERRKIPKPQERDKSKFVPLFF